jgi:hypothetical protein
MLNVFKTTVDPGGRRVKEIIERVQSVTISRTC